jgi:thymidylate synthase
MKKTMNEADEKYRELVWTVLREGNYKENRTGVSTISYFGYDYTIDNSDSYPLLTTKKMDGYRWDSMIHELFWYLSGEHHIKNLQEHTSIWDAWADEDGNLDTAYGRFWRRYPVPSVRKGIDGETWDRGEWSNLEEREHGETQFVFDQIQYVIDNLKENPNSRRHVVTAWHPANAAVSTLPPCHYTFVFNVQGDRLNLQLTQRSGDIALGVPFNLACYTLLQRMIAQEVGLNPGKFHHSITDAHIYCGEGERGEWYEENLSEIQDSLDPVYKLGDVDFDDELPEDPNNLDHVPGLLKQTNREAYPSPSIEIADKPFDELGYEDVELKDYESHEGIDFGVAE